MSNPFKDDFDPTNFPDLYPKNLQDEVNESYSHDKVMPRVEGTDYKPTAQDISEEGTEKTEGYSEEGSGSDKYN